MGVAAVNTQELGIQLVVMFANTVIITALLAVFSLWRYRKAVLVGMRGQTGADLMLPALRIPEERSVQAPDLSGALAWERRAQVRTAIVYVISVACAALPLALLYIVQSDIPRTPMHVVMIASIYLSAAAPMAALSLAWTWKRGAAFAALLLVAGAVLATLLSMVQRPFYGRAPSLDQLFNFVLFFALAAPILSVPLLFLLGSGSSRLRGIVPAIFGGLILFGMAPWLGYWLTFQLIGSESGLRLIAPTVGIAGLHAPFLLLAVPVGFIAWLRIHQLSRSYAAKRFSDTQLIARMWWLMFVADIVGELTVSTRGNVALTLAGGIAAYLLFPLTNGWLFERSGLSRGREKPRTLLLLRTFGFRARTEKLFDRIGSRWRYFGPVTVIAAPDVIARTLDPGDFLGWLTGRVDESFVRSQADLDERLAAFDRAPDPDGRYRVNEFCCRNDTWQATVVSLMDSADAIVMDLRGLTAKHCGCEFELQQLAARVDPARVVLVVDGATDRKLIGAQPWHVLEMSKGDQRETNAVFEVLLRVSS
jgi:hypothetical protein